MCRGNGGRVSLDAVDSLYAPGRVNWKVVPRSELAVADRRPPCDSMIDRLIESPIPVPCVLVVKNASKILSACSRGSPTPVSVTEGNSEPSGVFSDYMVRTPGVPVSLMASMAFSERFMNTCCN